MRDFSFVFCCGFPKCGTTTVAALLDSFSECSLHLLKEPNFFLKESSLTAEYISQFPDKNAEYLVDFSTFYGLKSKRKRALANIKAAGLMENARFVVCIRNPADQSVSYLKHIRTRRGETTDSIQMAIEDSQDFGQCIEDLLVCSNSQRVFVVKFEDIKSQENQNNLSRNLRIWLNLPERNTHRKLVRLNSMEDYAEYRGALKKIVEIAKKAGISRFFGLQYRQKLRSRLGVKPEKYLLSAEDLEIVRSLNYQDALNFYLKAHTGVLSSVSLGS